MPSTSRSCPVKTPASAGAGSPAAPSGPLIDTLPWLDRWAASKVLISVDNGGVGAEPASDPPDRGSLAVEGRLRTSGALKVANSGRTATDALDSTGLAAKPLDCLSSFVFLRDCQENMMKAGTQILQYDKFNVNKITFLNKEQIIETWDENKSRMRFLIDAVSFLAGDKSLRFRAEIGIEPTSRVTS
jgi:hypothetical protein